MVVMNTNSDTGSDGSENQGQNEQGDPKKQKVNPGPGSKKQKVNPGSNKQGKPKKQNVKPGSKNVKPGSNKQNVKPGSKNVKPGSNKKYTGSEITGPNMKPIVSPNSNKGSQENPGPHNSSKSRKVKLHNSQRNITSKSHESLKKIQSLPTKLHNSQRKKTSKSHELLKKIQSLPTKLHNSQRKKTSKSHELLKKIQSLPTKSAVNPCDQAKYTLEEIQNLKDGIKSCIDKIQIKSCDNITEYTEENKKSESEELEEYLIILERLNNSAAQDFIKDFISKPAKPKEYYIPYIAANLIQRKINLRVIAKLLNIEKIDNAPYFYHNLLKDLGYKYSLENFLNIYSFGKNRTITKILAEAKKIYLAIDKLKEYDIIDPDDNILLLPKPYNNIFLLPKHVELIEDIKKLLSSISFVNLPIIMKSLTIYQLMNIKKVLICLIIIEGLIHSYEISDKKDKDFNDDNVIKPCLLLQNIYLYLFIFLLKYSDSNSDSKSVINDELIKYILIICLIIEKGGIFQNNQPIQLNSYPILDSLSKPLKSSETDNIYTLSPDNITHNIVKKIHAILVDKGFNFNYHLLITSSDSEFGYDGHKIVKNENVSKENPSKDIPIENKLIEKLLGTQEEVGTHKTDVREEDILKLWVNLDIDKDSKVFDRLPDFSK